MARKPQGSIVTRLYLKLQYTDESGRQRETTQRVKTRAHAKQLKREAVKRWPKAKGSVNERLYARVRYTKGGRAREFMRSAVSTSDAEDKIRDLIADLKAGRNPEPVKALKTFSELAKYYEDTELQPAEFRDGQQIAGKRSLKPALSAIKPLKEYFGDWFLKDITVPEIKKYKVDRLRTPTRGDIARHQREKLAGALKAKPDSTRTLAAVHRELQRLRTMLRLAKQKKWLDTDDQFQHKTGLIQPKLERKRKRVLSMTEEKRLWTLAAIDVSTCGRS